MPLKKTLLSVLTICVFITYATYERMNNDSASLIALVSRDLAGRSPAVETNATGPTVQSFTAAQPSSPAPIAARIRVQGDEEDGEGFYEDDAQFPVQQAPAKTQPPAAVPLQTQAPMPTPVQPTQQKNGQYRDGSYTGPSVNVYYGYVQVRATIQGGKLADIQFLQYPSDRNRSVQINTYAMPILKQEAISTQSAQVDGVSGASATSQGFVESLGSALTQARV